MANLNSNTQIWCVGASIVLMSASNVFVSIFFSSCVVVILVVHIFNYSGEAWICLVWNADVYSVRYYSILRLLYVLFGRCAY